MRKLKPSTIYILQAMLWFGSKPNLQLYKPYEFFNELERLDRLQSREQDWIRAAEFRQDYYRAKRRGFFEIANDGFPELTVLGKKELAIFTPEKLKGAILLVTFDIEERHRAKRHQLRTLLRMLKFKQSQKSVWVSRYDSRDFIREEVKRLRISHAVFIYEARDITVQGDV